MDKKTILILFLISCSDVENQGESENFLNLYMNSEKTESLYNVIYTSSESHSYTKVYYQTNGFQIVDWFSDDEFCVEFMNDVICEPIINYSTYSREDGSGQQIIRLQKSFIGDTLTIKGCLLNDLCESLSFILTD